MNKFKIVFFLIVSLFLIIGAVSATESLHYDNITELLEHPDPEIRLDVIEQLNNNYKKIMEKNEFASLLIDFLEDENHSVRNKAFQLLQNLGFEVVPLLDKAYSNLVLDENKLLTRRLVVNLLGEIGDKGLFILLEALEDSYWEIRREAINSIEKINSKEKQVVFAVAERLFDENVNVRRVAANALVTIGPYTEEVIPHLFLAASYGDNQTLLGIYRALQAINPNIDILSIVAKILRQEEIERRRQAVKAFNNLQFVIKPTTEELSLFIFELLPNEKLANEVLFNGLEIEINEEILQKIIEPLQYNFKEKSEKITIIKWLGQLKLEEKLIKTLVIKLGNILITENDVGIIYETINTLKLIDSRNRGLISIEVYTTLIKKLLHPNSEIRKITADFLGHLGLEKEITVHFLLKLLEDDSAEVKKSAIKAIDKIGYLTKEGVPDIMRLLNNNNDEVRIAAVRVLSRMKIEEAVPKLVNLIEDESRYVRRVVVEALDMMAIDVADVDLIVPILSNVIIDEKDIQIKRAALSLLEKLGSHDAKSVPNLVKILNDETVDNNIRLSAMRILEQVGSDAEEAIPVLVDLMLVDDVIIQWQAVNTFKKIGSIDILLEMLKQEQGNIRGVIMVVLREIANSSQKFISLLYDIYNDEQEDINLRAEAARSLGEITNIDKNELLQKLPSKYYELLPGYVIYQAYSQSEKNANEILNQWSQISGHEESWNNLFNALAALYLNTRVEEANQIIQRHAKKNPIPSEGLPDFYPGMTIYARLFYMFNQDSSHFLGRLTSETEEKMKKQMWRYVKTRSRVEDVNLDNPLSLINTENHDVRQRTSYYLFSAVLKDEPEYKDKTYDDGYTAEDHFNVLNEFYKEHYKLKALNGLFIELGSHTYTKYTTTAFLAMAEFAPDEIIRKRARMYLDLIWIEDKQISFDYNRGGGRNRVTASNSWNNPQPDISSSTGGRYMTMIAPLVFGDTPSHINRFTVEWAVSDYKVPETAIILQQFGEQEPSYEITNRVIGELVDTGGYSFYSRLINYAYKTPYYVIGGMMFDPTSSFSGISAQRRWAGIIFNDKEKTRLAPFPEGTGRSKRHQDAFWLVAYKNVMIVQKYKNFRVDDMRVFIPPKPAREEIDGWVFVDVGDAFAAVKPAYGGYTWDTSNDWFDSSTKNSVVMILEDEWAPIIIHVGDIDEFNSFNNFKKEVLKSSIKVNDESVKYVGPGQPEIEFYYNEINEIRSTSDSSFALQNGFGYAGELTLPKINGKTINFDLDKTYDSRYLKSEVGSKKVVVTVEPFKVIYDFENNNIIK